MIPGIGGGESIFDFGQVFKLALILSVHRFSQFPPETMVDGIRHFSILRMIDVPEPVIQGGGKHGPETHLAPVKIMGYAVYQAHHIQRVAEKMLSAGCRCRRTDHGHCQPGVDQCFKNRLYPSRRAFQNPFGIIEVQRLYFVYYFRTKRTERFVR